MRIAILAAAFVLYTAGTSLVYAGCNHSCAKGQTYNYSTGACETNSASS